MPNKDIGTFNWGLKTGGNLNMINKIGISIQAISLLVMNGFQKSRSPAKLNIENIQLPDSKLISQTLELIKDLHGEPLRNHCMRSFVIGSVLGKIEDVKYDSELFAISALLHDIGLEDQICGLHKNIDCFAIEGAQEAGAFLERHQVSENKVKIVKDAISLHLNIKVPKPLNEAYLLNKATVMDTVGTYANEVSRANLSDIVTRYPRLSFNEDVNRMLKNQCQLRPKSRVSFLYFLGFEKRLLKLH